MIVRCPECETAFNLPDNKITPRGSKVRCSRCSHTFRVRLGDDGGPEIFYKNEGVADPPTQELGDHLFDEGFTDDLDDAFEESIRPSEAVDESDEESDPEEDIGRSTMMGLPAQSREESDSPFKSNRTSGDFIPFPLAGKAKKTPQAETESDPNSGIDLFDGEEPAPPESEATEDDPFEGAFESNETTGSDDILQPRSGPRAAPPQSFQPPPSAAPAPAPKATPAPDAQNDDHDIFSGQQGEFGPADDLVDPEFGQDTPHFDPESGPTAAPPAKARPAPKQPASTGPKPAPKPKPKPVAQASEPVVEDWDVAPHTVGGGGFQKFANFVLIVLICAAAFIGVIVFQSDGVVDFTRFDHMLSVAFEGEEFEPREAWIPPPPPPVAPEVENAIEVENAFASLIPIGRRGESQVLIVNGVARNATDGSIERARLRVMILDDKGKVLREETVAAGRTVAFEDISGLSSTAAIDGLALNEAVAVPAEGAVEFMAIFKEVPAAVLEHRKVDYRIEVVEPR